MNNVAFSGVFPVDILDSRVLPQLREQATVHAFGARALKINKDIRKASSTKLAEAPEQANAPAAR